MKSTYATLALIATTGMVAFGQATQPNTPSTQSPSSGQQTPSTQSQPMPRPTTAAGQQATMTWTGCIQSETDFRRMQGAGRAGVAGTGIGAGNEFILTNASMSPAGSSTAATSGSSSASSGVAGTAGASTTSSSAFELTGSGEGQAAALVGRRVEVTGHLKPAEVAGGTPSGGPTAGAPPRGVDVASSDLRLREIEVTSVRAAAGGGTCAAAGTPAQQPAGAQPSQQP